jgi:hypothetical protein
VLSRGQEEEGRHGSAGDWTIGNSGRNSGRHVRRCSSLVSWGRSSSLGDITHVHQNLQIQNERPQLPKYNPEINQSNDSLASEQDLNQELDWMRSKRVTSAESPGTQPKVFEPTAAKSIARRSKVFAPPAKPTARSLSLCKQPVGYSASDSKAC